MRILTADVMGFCFGVRRAIQLAEESLAAGRRVNALGPLVHNAQETARLDAAGVRVVDALDQLDGDTVVVRAHGAGPDALATLRARGLHVVDATCPFVRKSQRLAAQIADDGQTLVIIGHPNHPEVQGILAYGPTPAYVITHPHEVDALPAGIIPGVIAQTTVNEQTFREIVSLLQARYPNCAVYDTVCSATRERQEAARRLAAQVEAVYVIGGRHSSNTNRLTEVCRQACPRTYLIETADEINPADIHGLQAIGVTAGASTPDWLIEQVLERLRALDAEMV